MTPQVDQDLVKSILYDSAYTKIENYELYPGNWIIRSNNTAGTTNENYKISKPIELKKDEEIYFLWYGNNENGHRAIGLADSLNTPVTSVVGVVPADQGIGGFSNTNDRLVSYKATCDCYVVLCRYGFDSDTPIYKCHLTANTLKARLELQDDYIFDTAGCNMSTLVSGQVNKTFVIRYQHNITNTPMVMAAGCTILFLGGSIENGSITFSQTSLQGNVNLNGCIIAGSVANETFNAAWACHRDGSTNDSAILNAIMQTCKHVLLEEGTYLLGATLTLKKSNFVLEGVGNAILKSASLGINTPKILGIEPISYSAGHVTNVTIKGVTFQMVNNYSESDYDANKTILQQIHAITARGVKQLTIHNCQFKRIIGDGIYLGLYRSGSSVRHNQDIYLNDNIIDGEGMPSRNGISVIDGNSVWIESNFIDNTTAACMPGAIDIEPNDNYSQIESIHIINNHINRCRGGVASIVLAIHDEACAAHNVHICGNNIECTPAIQGINPRAFYIKLCSNTESSNIVIADNTIGNNFKHFYFNSSSAVRNFVSSNNVSD